jgi:hypothetical protein
VEFGIAAESFEECVVPVDCFLDIPGRFAARSTPRNVATMESGPGSDYNHQSSKLASPGQQICWCIPIAAVYLLSCVILGENNKGAPSARLWLFFPSYHTGKQAYTSYGYTPPNLLPWRDQFPLGAYDLIPDQVASTNWHAHNKSMVRDRISTTLAMPAVLFQQAKQAIPGPSKLRLNTTVVRELLILIQVPRTKFSRVANDLHVHRPAS